jgi:osmotically-inducible protein OsmY
MKSDGQIQQDVLHELKGTPASKRRTLGEGRPCRGHAQRHRSNYVKKMAAQDAAHRVEGVLDVVNHIQVHVPGLFARTDTQIAQAVRQALGGMWWSRTPRSA